MFEICWKFCCHMQFSHTTHLCPNTLPNHSISEKIPKNRFEDMELTADGSYSMWDFLSKLEKEWNLHEWSTKAQHSLGVFYLAWGVFKGCKTLLWKLTCYDLRVFQHFQDKSNFSGVFKKAFSQPHCLLFLKQHTDRQMDLLF